MEQGRFATNVELAETNGYIRSQLAEPIWFLRHDFDEPAVEQGFLPCLAPMDSGGYPEITEKLADALNKLVAAGKLKTNPMKGMVAAVSVGIVNGEAICDLEYIEDSAAETDMNVVMTEDGRIIEVQGTAEGEPFTHEELLTLLALARGGIESIVTTQKAALEN